MLSNPLLKFLISNNLDVASYSTLKGGRNSHVFLLSHCDGSNSVLKLYPCDSMWRLKREVQFLQLLDQSQQIPRLKLFSAELNCSIISYIQGEPVRNRIKAIESFVNFVSDINSKFKQDKEDYSSIINAQEAFLSISGLRENLCARFETLKIDLKKLDSLQTTSNKKIKVLLNEMFSSALDSLEMFESKLSRKDVFASNNLILSPSDVGFHNMLQSSLIYYFIDFEYAGLDHPTKLFCDFILQPDSSLSVQEARLMLGCVDNMDYYSGLINVDHVIAMLPVYRFKWAVIIVNRMMRQVNWQNQSMEYIYNFAETTQNTISNL